MADHDLDNPARRKFLGYFAGLTAGSLLARLSMSEAMAQTAPTYKALVCVFLYGGNDGNNMVVPTTSQGYAAYAGVRGGSGRGNWRPGGYYGHGYSTGAYWQGGYWRGGFWPRCYYGVGFSWFLPILPLAYSTYWYGGLPYYYANDVYYTYNPSYEGYVATDPPPIADSSVPAEGAAPSAGPAPGDGAAAASQIFMYPKNGQSAEQTATDKAECQQWAEQQAGQVAQNGSDYQRAMAACVEGRGYSAR